MAGEPAPSIVWKRVRNAEAQAPAQTNQNLHFIKILRWFMGTVKIEKLVSDTVSLGRWDRPAALLSSYASSITVLLSCHIS